MTSVISDFSCDILESSTLPFTSVANTIVVSTANEVTKPPGFRSKELPPTETKKQRNTKHSKQSTKSQQHLKANPAAMPGSISVLEAPSFPTIKLSEGGLLPQHSSSVLIGGLIPLEATSETSRSTSDLIINPQVTLPPSRIAAPLLPPFSEIAMELNGRTVTLSRDITAVTNAIGDPIPAMSCHL